MSDSNSNYLKTPPNWRFDVEAGHYTDEAERLAGNLSESVAARMKALNAKGWADACAATPTVDNEVVRPAHYTRGAVECIDAIEAALTPEEYRGYLKGNVLKYFWRERDKGGLQSIQKAEYYTQRLIKLLGEKQDE
jgi:hypothetical protein